MWGCHVPQYSMTGVVGWETSDPSTVLYCGLGLLAAVVAFKRPLKMEYSGDIKRYALYLLISEGFFHWPIFFLFVFLCVWAHAQSCPTLCNTMDYSPPGSSVHEFSQTRILEWVAMLSSRGSSRPRDRTHIFCISCIGRHILYYHATWEAPV